MFHLHESLKKLNKGFKRLFEARPPSAADVAKAYKIFDLRPGSDLSNLNAQWKTLARKHHPDLGGSLEKMKDVNWAKDILDGIASSGSRGYSSYSYDPPKPPPRRPSPKQEPKKEPKQEPKKDHYSDDEPFDVSSMSEADQKKYHSLSLKILKAAHADKFALIAKLDALKAKYKSGAKSDDKKSDEPKSERGSDKYKTILRDIKGIEPGEKDIQRMKDIITKSNGSQAKMMSLVRVMAGAITDKDKAQRRAAAAYLILPPEIAEDAVMLFLSKY
jgi:hypothetical protein